MNKKAQGLPLNTVIIAAIVLIVLVVIVAIFTGRISIFASDLNKQASADAIKAEFQASTPCKVTKANVANVLKGAAGDDGKLNGDEQPIYDTALDQAIADCDSKSQADCIEECIWKG